MSESAKDIERISRRNSLFNSLQKSAHRSSEESGYSSSNTSWLSLSEDQNGWNSSLRRSIRDRIKEVETSGKTKEEIANQKLNIASKMEADALIAQQNRQVEQLNAQMTDYGEYFRLREESSVEYRTKTIPGLKCIEAQVKRLRSEKNEAEMEESKKLEQKSLISLSETSSVKQRPKRSSLQDTSLLNRFAYDPGFTPLQQSNNTTPFLSMDQTSFGAQQRPKTGNSFPRLDDDKSSIIEKMKAQLDMFNNNTCIFKKNETHLNPLEQKVEQKKDHKEKDTFFW